MLRVAEALQLETYAWVLNAFNYGEAHTTLVGGHKWYDDAAESAHTRRSIEELRRIGFLGGPNNDLTNLGEDVFHVMQHAEVEYFTYLRVGDTPATARAAAVGTDALLIVCMDGQIDVEGVDRRDMVRDLARALPPMPPARIPGLTADLDVLKKLIAGEQIVGGNQIADAKKIAQWLSQEQQNFGEMHAAIRPRYDAKSIKSANPPPSWIDADGGRALLHVKNGWASLKPARPEDVANMFLELERSIAGAER